MSDVPPQRAMGALTLDSEDLIDRMSRDLERAISFAEECRWRCPELTTEADQLAAAAIALFGKTLRSVHSAEPASNCPNRGITAAAPRCHDAS